MNNRQKARKSSGRLTFWSVLLLALAPGACALLPAAEQGLDLNAAVAEAVGAGKNMLRLAEGTYRVNDTATLTGRHEFTIDGGGARLIFPGGKSAFRIIDCNNLTLKNFSLDYAELSFTQGVVTEVDPAAGRFSFRIDAGYPALSPEFRMLHVFDGKTGLWKAGAPDLNNGWVKLEDAAGGLCRFRYLKEDSPLAGFLAPGDRLAADWRNTNSAVTLRRGCRNFRMEKVTILSSPSMGIVSRFNGPGHVYQEVKIMPGPRPEGATMDRLLSTCADGLNYAYGSAGPVLEHCDFSFMGDDGVNLHGYAFPLVKVEDERNVWLLRPAPAEEFAALLPEGAQARFLAKGNYSILGQEAIAGFAPITPTPKFENELLQRLLSRPGKKDNWFDRSSGAPKYSVYRLRLIRPLPGVALEAEMFADLPALNCPGFAIRHSFFHDHRGRGLRIMASDGVIEGNRFERIRQNAISLGAEFYYWREAGWISNVAILNNRILDVATDAVMTSPRCYAPGAIATFVRTDPGAAEVVAGHADVRIENNRIENSPVPGVFLQGALSAVVQGNTLRSTASAREARPGSTYGLIADEPVSVMKNCRDSVITNNDIK